MTCNSGEGHAASRAHRPSTEAASIFAAVRQHGALDVDALPPGDNVPAALAELEHIGLVDVDDGRVTMRTDDAAAVRALLRQDPTEVVRSLLEARLALDRVLGHRRPSEDFERITDQHTIVGRIGDLMESASREVLNLHVGEVPSQQALDGAINSDLALLRRGVAARTVCPQHFVTEERWRTYVDLMGEHGGVTRFADGVPHRLIVFDRRVAVVPMDPHNSRVGAVLVYEPATVRALHQLAETILSTSKPLAEAVASTEPLTEIEREVLKLMSTGLTDKSSAARMSVTERQFRRYVSRVMKRLGAQSRFQAGVKAVERGWL